MVRVKRVYDVPSPEDGFRVLVDRLWPRGLSKEAAAVDEWLKEIAPSHELRKWFHADPTRWPEFVDRYHDELKEPARAAALDRLRGLGAEHPVVTLLFASRNEERNHARLLRDVLSAPIRQTLY